MKRIPICIAFSIFFLFASPAYAAELNAGFPSDAVWVSKTNVTSGETIELFSAIYNGGNEELRGTVVFTVDGESVGTKDVVLASGASELVSMEWKASAGEHSISAAIEGTSIATGQYETAPITIVVAESALAPLAETISSATNILKESARAAKPVISSVSGDIYALTESVRLDAISILEDIVYPRDEETVGAVFGTSTANINLSTPDASKETPSGISQIKQVAAAAALIALKSKALFYPLLILFLFAILYWLFRWAFRRP